MLHAMFFIRLQTGEPLKLTPNHGYEKANRRSATLFRSYDAAIASAYLRGFGREEFKIEELSPTRPARLLPVTRPPTSVRLGKTRNLAGPETPSNIPHRIQR